MTKNVNFAFFPWALLGNSKKTLTNSFQKSFNISVISQIFLPHWRDIISFSLSGNFFINTGTSKGPQLFGSRPKISRLRTFVSVSSYTFLKFLRSQIEDANYKDNNCAMCLLIKSCGLPNLSSNIFNETLYGFHYLTEGS